MDTSTTAASGSSEPTVDEDATINKLSSTCCPITFCDDWKRACKGGVNNSLRVKRDIGQLMKNSLHGIYTAPIENDLMCVQALVIGNEGTPYEGGFFHFFIRCGPTYPFDPPRVCAMSCYRFGHMVRFNPNLYINGRVCLSILGTWDGPEWTAGTNLGSVIMSIQSLLSDQALCNEPGFQIRRDTQDKLVAFYDLYVTHETLRVSVVATLKDAEGFRIPDTLIEKMQVEFLKRYEFYLSLCDKNMNKDGATHSMGMMISTSFTPEFAAIKASLIELHKHVTAVRDQRQVATPPPIAPPATVEEGESSASELSS